jgi:hypothetical protein
LLSKFHISSRLLWAILISLILHLVLAGGWHVLLPNLDFSTHVIKAELALPPAKKTTLPPKKHVAKRAMKRSAPKPTSSPSVASGPSLVTEPAYVPVPMIGEEDRPPYEEPKALPPPKYVETEFEVKKTGFGSGKARYRFDLVGEGRYHLQSEVQAVGLASLAFSGKRLETSVGSVTEYGLRPDSYRYEISSKPEKFQGADFDWVNHQVTLSTAKSKETVDLPDDAQDFLSFMYQFMFVPPLDRMQHSLTNGKTLHTIDYLFVSEDQIASKLGNLNTVHIAKSSGDSDERTELWLAVDYRFIPVKILKIAKDGSGYELLVTRIDTDIGKE